MAEGSLTLNQIISLAVVAEALAGAGISLDMIESVTMTATSVSASLVTPDERTLTVSAEVRTVTVEGENRIVKVGAEDRTMVILP